MMTPAQNKDQYNVQSYYSWQQMFGLFTYHSPWLGSKAVLLTL
jgi:hypothetical protein